MSSRYEPGSFLDVLPEADSVALVAAGRPRTYRKAAPLLVEGEASDRVAVIVSGRVKVFVNTDDGREALLATRSWAGASTWPSPRRSLLVGPGHPVRPFRRRWAPCANWAGCRPGAVAL